MTVLELRQVRKVFAGATRAAVDGCDLVLPAGQVAALLGPAGSGKSTLLRMIAGLEPITEGEILLGGRCINQLAPRARDVALVFQNYALSPHLTIYANIALGLAMRRTAAAELDSRVRRAAQTLGMSDLLERRPAALSQTQRHRVAIARAIAGGAGVLLFDAPFGGVDPAARAALLAELRALQPALGVTLIYATTVPAEAEALGGTTLTMHTGKLAAA